MYVVFLLLLLTFMLVSLVKGVVRKKKSDNVFSAVKTRSQRYFSIMVWMWGPAMVVVAICFIAGIPLTDLGLRGVGFNQNIWLTAIVLAIGGALFIISLRTLVLSLASPKFREKMRTDLAEDAVAKAISPRTKKEKGLYVLLSFSSGICEELLYRGLLAFLLQAAFPQISIILVILISGLLFGLGHLYQGWQGVVQTGVIGTLFMCLLFVTNSLIPVMTLHFIINVSDSLYLLAEDEANSPA